MRQVESATPLSLDPDCTLPVSLTHPVTSTSSDSDIDGDEDVLHADEDVDAPDAVV